MKTYYETSDMGVAVVLEIKGYKIADVDKSNPKRVVFKFQEDDKLHKIVADYWNKNLKIDALTMQTAIKNIKGRLYN